MFTSNRNDYAYYSKNHNAIHHVIIAVCAAVVLCRTTGFSFLVGWDDQWFVLNNYTEDGFGWKNLSSIFTDFYYGQYAPLNQLYYTFVYYWFGYEPACYHIGGVLVHLANAAIVYSLTTAVSRQISGSADLKNAQIAFATALLFAISPINLEPVAWVSASKVTLYALFYLLSLSNYCAYIRTANPRHYYLTMLFFALLFGAKEQAVTLPLCLLLMDYLFKRDLRSAIIWYEKLPFFLLSILFGIVTIQSQGVEITENTNFYPLWQRAFLSLFTTVEYFVKAVVPVNISYIYPFPFQVGQPMPTWLWLYPPILILTCYLLYKQLAKRWVFFGLAFFAIHILLVVNIVSLARFSVVADRYAYISTIGIYFMAGSYFVNSLYKMRRKALLLGVGAAYILYFAIYTNMHSAVWKNAITLKGKLRATLETRADYNIWKSKSDKE